MKLNIDEEKEAGAAAYNEMVKNDPRLRAELEAKDRLFRDKEEAKRKEEHEKEKNKEKTKRKMRSRSRRRF